MNYVMHNKLRFGALLMASVMLMTSCDKEDETTLSPEKAELALNNVDTELANELGNLGEAEGFVALQSLAGLTGAGTPLPTGRVKEVRKNPALYVRAAVSALDQMISGSTTNARTSGAEPFYYDEHKGVYTWNPTTEAFEKTATSTIIEIRFPTEGSSTNNATFRLTAYSETLVQGYYEPTVIEANLDVNGVRQVTISAEVEYNESTGEANFADLTYFVNPYTFEMDLDDRSPSSASFSQYLKKGNDTLIGWSLAATYNAQYPKEGGTPKSLTGTFQLSNVIFTIVLTAPTSMPQGEVDINDYVKITISVDGKLAGHVVWVLEDGAADYTPYVQFTDGSTVPLEEIFEALEAALNDLDESFNGTNVAG